jgi:integrase-like protein
MRAEKRGEGLVIQLMRERGMAQNLRRWLKKARVTRPELHVWTSTRTALTWHDLRATGATWMAVRGDDPLKIKQRCGHRSFSTTEVYILEAEAVREGFGDVFPVLPETLLRGASGFRTSSARVRNLRAHLAGNTIVSAERAGFEPAAGF